ncbi:MAG: hypothetical protein ACI837_000742 [Crocinitomicaceae bacterium]|jgi:uncharacterized protein (TIGR00369 family)
MQELQNHPIVKAYIANNHFGAMLDMDFDVTEPGKVINTMPILEKHLATPRAAHGGAVCSLMDATMGICALSQVILSGQVVSTIEMKISFVSPALLGEVLTGTAETIKRGNRLVFVEGQIHDRAGNLIATASGTFNTYPSSKAGF